MAASVRESLAEAFAPAVPIEPAELAALFERPPDPAMGDYALPCFRLAKTMKSAPQKIASEIAGKVAPGGLVASVEAAGPFVNVRVDRGALATEVLGRVVAAGDSYGSSNAGAGRTVIVEYSSPNIAKPFSIGHLRSTILGHALAELHEALGWKVIRINFPGDWGTQFGMMITAFRRWGDEAGLAAGGVGYLVDLYVKANAEVKGDATIEADARAAFRELEEGAPEATGIWKRFHAASMKEFGAIYERLGVRFDVTSGESVHNERLGPLVERYRDAGLALESEGAVVVEMEEGDLALGDDAPGPPCMLVKSDGGSTYATRDLAAAIFRAEEYGFDRMLYVVGADQKLHFRQVFRALERLGMEWAPECVHVDFGLVRFGSAKMSTREGNVVLLEEVLGRSVELAGGIIEEKNSDLADRAAAAEAVGVGAVKFADICRKRSKDVSFDWDEILRFDGETGPYLQYTHARLASILRKGGSEQPARDADLSVLAEPEEAAVVMLLEEFGERLGEAAGQCEPYIVANYLLALAGTTNRFYNNHRVIGSGGEVQKARLVLTWAAKTVIGRGLAMLGLVALEEM